MDSIRGKVLLSSVSTVTIVIVHVKYASIKILKMSRNERITEWQKEGSQRQFSIQPDPLVLRLLHIIIFDICVISTYIEVYRLYDNAQQSV